MNRIREQKPLIHMITNDVSRESCVNIVLAAGGSAICAEDAAEVCEIVNLADGLYLNMGMPSPAKAEAMKKALEAAKKRGIPVLLDPVGVGASSFRKKLADDLFKIGGITCIRGNAGEIGYLCGKKAGSKGVETVPVKLTDEELMALSEKTGALIMVSGETDYLVSPGEVIKKPGGGEIFTRITGSGCMQSAYLAACLASCLTAYQAANEISGLKSIPGKVPFREALIQGVSVFDAAGRLAAFKVQKSLEEGEKMGTGSFAAAFLDAICNL